jgi:hypothetical protein
LDDCSILITEMVKEVDAGNWIALYAAIVATGALAWQAWVRWQERRPRLRVDLRLTIFVSSLDDAMALKEL